MIGQVVNVTPFEYSPLPGISHDSPTLDDHSVIDEDSPDEESFYPSISFDLKDEREVLLTRLTMFCRSICLSLY